MTDIAPMSISEAGLYAHARIDALQTELSYLLARIAAGEDPNPGLERSRDVAERMADFIRGFKQCDNYVRPQ